MLTLALAMRAAEDEGTPLPPVFPQLERLGARPRRGQVTLIGAGPGGGKSAIVSEWVINLADEDGRKLRGMYFSADTDRMTLGKRAAAGVLGCTLDETEKFLKTNEHEIWEKLEGATSHIWMCFDPGLTLDDIEDEIQTYATVNGEWPEFVVIDVLMNVQGENSDGDHTAFAEAMKWFHQMSRETNSAFFVLHHVTGPYENGDEPIPLGGILGKVTKLARMVLTLHKTSPNMLGVSVVKNSSGPGDSGGWAVKCEIPWVPERSWFGRDVTAALPTAIVADTDSEEETPNDWKVWGSVA